MDKSGMIKLAAATCVLAAGSTLWATPTTDDCVAGSGCIQLPGGGRGVFEFFADFDVDSNTSRGSVTYSDANYTVSSTALYDYADPDGPGGYRILSFRLSDPDYPTLNEIRIVVADFGSAIDDYFEIQLHGGIFYAVGGNLLPDCGTGIAISQDCSGPNIPPPPPPRECEDFLTGGGWIVGPSGAKANFGVHGGMKPDLWGGLNYLDHGTGLHVKSTAVTGYTHLDAIGRQINFDVKIDGVPGTAIVKVWDNGEPGRNDVFQIVLSTGYSAGGDLGGARPGGGNLQLHKAKCDKPNKGNSSKSKGSAGKK